MAKIEHGQPLGETDDMAIAGIISSQLFFFQFVKDFQRAEPLSDRDDIKVCDCRTGSVRSALKANGGPIANSARRS